MKREHLNAICLSRTVPSTPIPHAALFTTPAVDSFVRRVELGIAVGGFGATETAKGRPLAC